MQKTLFFVAALILFAACNKEPIPVSYGDIEVTKFAYDEIPSEGGSVSPQLEYKYKVTMSNGETKELTSGASLSYSCESRITVDKATGVVTAKMNETVNQQSYAVEVNITKETAHVSKVISVMQKPSKEEIISTETFQLPLTLGEHESYYDYRKVEIVYAKGVDIPVYGGDIVNVNTYRSGKKDTVVVEKAAFETKTEYRFISQQRFYDNKEYETEDDPTQAPASSYRNGIWKVNMIGYGVYKEISHTLSATAGGKTQSISIYQQNNEIVGNKPTRYCITDHRFYTERDDWPNFEDYPVGCPSPKWAKSEYGEYYIFEETKDLHPDGDRDIRFFIEIECDVFYDRRIYTSGAIDPEVMVPLKNKIRDMWTRGVVITATADVKLKDGTTKNIKHTYEWIQPEDGKRYIARCFKVNVPLVEGAAEDFEWKFQMRFNLTEKNYILSENPKENTNFFEYDWNIPVIEFKDCLKTVKEFEREKMLSGMYTSHSRISSPYADIIDGVRQ